MAQSLSILANRAINPQNPIVSPHQREARNLSLTQLRGNVADDEQKRQRGVQIRQILQESGGDFEAAGQKVMAIDPVVGEGLIRLGAQRKQQALTEAEQARTDEQRQKDEAAFQEHYRAQQAQAGHGPSAKFEADSRLAYKAQQAQIGQTPKPFGEAYVDDKNIRQQPILQPGGTMTNQPLGAIQTPKRTGILEQVYSVYPEFDNMSDEDQIKALQSVTSATQKPPAPGAPHVQEFADGKYQWESASNTWKKIGDAPKSQGAQAEFEWIKRDGKPLQIRKGTAKPGDTPYDAVSERSPGATGPSPYATERAARTIASVDELMGQISGWNTGLGSVFDKVPTSSARGFKAKLDTLKSNIAFNELAQMREASKSGGALGAISERELQLLESTLGALDTGQTAKELKDQLQKVKESVERWQKEVVGAAPNQPLPGGNRGGKPGDPLGIF